MDTQLLFEALTVVAQSLHLEGSAWKTKLIASLLKLPCNPGNPLETSTNRDILSLITMMRIVQGRHSRSEKNWASSSSPLISLDPATQHVSILDIRPILRAPKALKDFFLHDRQHRRFRQHRYPPCSRASEGFPLESITITSRIQ